MIKSVLVALLGLSAPAFGQELQDPASVLSRPTSFVAFPTIYSAPSAITLTDQSPFSFHRTFAWTSATPAEFLPDLAFGPATPLGMAAPMETGISRPGSGNFIPRIDYAGGEVGFLFGKSLDGPLDREIEGGYILGEIITGKTHIEVGASYSREKISR